MSIAFELLQVSFKLVDLKGVEPSKCLLAKQMPLPHSSHRPIRKASFSSDVFCKHEASRRQAVSLACAGASLHEAGELRPIAGHLQPQAAALLEL